MIKVVLFGAGNVASHLAETFLANETIELIQIYNRTAKSLKRFHNKVATTTSLSNIAIADVYIIAIADDFIADFSEKLPKLNGLVVHTSGSVAMKSLAKKNNRGIFYPLQTFTKDKKVDFKQIPICIEAEADEDLQLLEKLAKSISDKVFFINSKQRKSLHVAAVFVNNFTNHLYHLGNEICNEYDVPFQVLEPLIQETAHKVLHVSPIDAQTGPAKRNDYKTIEAHLALLNKKQQKIYKLLTKSIQKTYGKEL